MYVTIYRISRITNGLSHHVSRLDTQGNVVKVQFNNQVRDSHLDVPVDKVPQLYRAMKMYFNLLYEHSIQFKMQDGNVHLFNYIQNIKKRNILMQHTYRI